MQGRLASVMTNNQTTTFYYDADGNRLLTVQPDGTKVYTPFPEFEETRPVTGDITQRSFYYLAGQLMAVRVKVNPNGTASTYYFTYTDHLGSIVNMTWTGGTPVDGAAARYEPFGGYHTRPATMANPDISDRGFTGHKGNNTGSTHLNLIYMNARYYMPEIGRFVSADTIVPEPGNPQSYNRYAYAYNDPINLIDPTGHCVNNYEAGSQDMDTCLAGWNAVSNYLAGAAFGPGGSGNFPNELVTDWLLNADIATLENLMAVMGISYGYTWTPPQGYTASGSGRGKSLRSPEFKAGICYHWQSCYEPALTSQEIPPDALLLPGFSLSAAGTWYAVVGVELLSNRLSNENSWFSYHGQGSGVALEAIGAGYGGLVWNLEQNRDYEGVFTVLTVEAAYYVGVKGSFFWETGTTPFTGETWGVAIGPGGGAGAGVTMSYADYTCEWGCSR